jgi:hypothetical protein
MTQRQQNARDSPEYDPIPDEHTLGDAFWGTGDVVYWLIRLRAHDA